MSRILFVAAVIGAMFASLSIVPGRFGQQAGQVPGGPGHIVFARWSDADQRHHTYAIAPGGGEATSLVDSDTCCALFSHGGARLLLDLPGPDGRVSVATMARDGTDPRAFTLPDGTLNLGPGAWAPDDSGVALEGWDDTDASRTGVYLADASMTGAATQLTTAPAGHHDVPLSFSPDGHQLLVAHMLTDAPEGPGSSTLSIVPVDGGPAVDIVTDGWDSPCCTFGSPASWAPDGSSIALAAVQSGTDGTSAVFIAEPATGVAHRISTIGSWTTSARFAPDGRHIVFDRGGPARGGQHQLVLIDPDGTHEATIGGIPAGLGVCCSVWSPDGTQVLVQGSLLGAQTELYVVNVDGSGYRRLTGCTGPTPSGSPCTASDDSKVGAVDGYDWGP